MGCGVVAGVGVVESQAMPETVISTELGRCSAALLAARDARAPIAPLTDSMPALSIRDAYAIAQLGVAADIERGARVVGHKIGLTSVTVQQQLGVSEPDYGALLDVMAIANGSVLAVGDYIAPRVELELAFTMGARLLGPGLTAEDVRAAVAVVHPAIELVDSRIADWRIRLADTVADRASSAGFVVGDQSFTLDEIDVSAVEVTLFNHDAQIEAGRSDAVLGDPCAAVAWLANALGELGESLEPGEMVLSGACTRMAAAQAGDEFRGVFEGLGELRLAFAAGSS